MASSDYFEFVLRAGPHGRAKPFSDMYHLAADKLNLPLGEILHVGDDLTTDVAGALRAGLQACWINRGRHDLMKTPPMTAVFCRTWKFRGWHPSRR